ncbi:hypothetical protein CAEBREN_16919 [Caenorhabditis brenneri]|uniref:Uncharacterized protein n=1 Tax=Caenorhabditis brenneri TaxID=135651 RepID=G0NQQ4_CAEBE|nr:hypothetical protein CAEBREN_16919 [Caenorhabditis brenneri]
MYVYQYLVPWLSMLVCLPEILQEIEGYKLIRIFVPCIICFVLWCQFVYWGMANTVEKQEYMKDELKFYYDEDSSKVSFIAPMYWSVDKYGERHWNFWEWMSSIGCFMIITILPFIMMYSPVGLLLTLPMFEVYVGRISNYAGASVSIYPSLEPVIAMICIKEFKKAFMCNKKKRKVLPTTTHSAISSSMHHPI